MTERIMRPPCPFCDKRDKRIAELEAERNDYKSRWEQTGCTRHHAMETAIALNQKKDKQLAAVRAVLDATENENYWQHNIRSRIREAIAGGEDGSK